MSESIKKTADEMNQNSDTEHGLKSGDIGIYYGLIGTLTVEHDDVFFKAFGILRIEQINPRDFISTPPSALNNEPVSEPVTVVVTDSVK